MSSDQNPDQHFRSADLDSTEVLPVHSDSLNDAVSWKEKYDAAAARGRQKPRNYRDEMSRGRTLGLWIAGGVLAGSAVTGASVALALGGDDAPNVGRSETFSGSNNEALSPGIELSDDELEKYTSDDPEARREVIDEKVITALQEGLRDPSKLNELTGDPYVVNQLQSVSENLSSRLNGTDKQIWVCPTDEDSTDNFSCTNRTSILKESQEIVLATTLSTLENFRGVDVDYTIPGVTLELNDDHFGLVAAQ